MVIKTGRLSLANPNSIDSISDLSEGLALLQQHVEQAEAIVQQLLVTIDTASNPELLQQLEVLLSNEVSGYSIGATADSFAEIETEQVDLVLLDHCLVGDTDQFEFIIVQNREDFIVARVDMELRVRAEATFGFGVHDSIDDDYVGLGSCSAATEDLIEASVLVTFEGDASEMNFDITRVEIVKAPRSIDFGFIEPYEEPAYEPDYEPPDEEDRPSEPNEPPGAEDRPQPEPPTPFS